MSPALITLIQTSLLQRQKSAVEDLPGSPEQKSAETAGAVAPITTTEIPLDSPSILARLVSVTKEIASIDAMIAKAEAGAPKCPEAQKWHEVSMTALAWSRESLAKEQRPLLLKLKEQFLAQQAPVEAPRTQPKECYQQPTAQPPAEHLDESAKDAQAAGSLRADLRKLQEYNDPQRCLLVRKIKKLGLDSARKLRDHFQTAGVVTEVLVAHSFEKPSAKRRHGRVRPAAMGFVVMESAAVASALMEGGEVQFVRDGEELVEVTVETFDPAMASFPAAWDPEA